MFREDILEPCKTCKVRHTQCVRTRDKPNCKRCLRLQIDCTFPDDDDEYYMNILRKTEDGDRQLQQWNTDVESINSELQHLFDTLFNVEQQQANAQRQTHKEWQLRVTNGVIYLETPIQTMEELQLFTQASIRYLSPFTGVFKREALRFDSTFISISFGLTNRIKRQEFLKRRNKRFSTLETSDNDISSLTPDHYRDIISQLIPLYLRYRARILGVLHEETFLEYYNSLEDPLTSALILAVCVAALASLGSKLSYSHIKRRVLAETFYDKCKILLFDLYDDPKRKLEVVLTTSFLQGYLTNITLNSLEAERLASVALLFCRDLKQRNSELTAVEKTLLQRHTLYLEACDRIYQMRLHKNVDFTLLEVLGKFDTIYNEPKITKQYIKLYNQISRLINSPYILAMQEKLNFIYIGLSSEIVLEDILQIVPIAQEWWSSLPTEYRLCDNPFDPETYQLLTQDKTMPQLLPLTMLHILTGSVCSSTLQPNVAVSPESPATINVVQSVRKAFVNHTLNSCRVLVHALRLNWNVDTSDFSHYSICILLHAQYFLEKIAQCSDIRFPYDLLDLFKESVAIKLSKVFPAEHEVPSSVSIMVTSREDSKISPYDIYEQYPFADDAQTADVIRSSMIQLDQCLKSLHK